MFYLVKLDNDKVGILSLASHLSQEKKDSILNKYIYKEVESLEDTSYQRAWQCNWEDTEDTSVSIDMVVAKDIYRDKIRPERDSLLEDLDVQFMLALEQSDTTKQSEVTADKQYLRDVTEMLEIEDCTSVQELEALDLLAVVRNKV